MATPPLTPLRRTLSAAFHTPFVFFQHQGYLSISFNDTYYQLAETPGRNEGVPPLSQAQVDALAAFREVANSVKLDFWLQPGDLQVCMYMGLGCFGAPDLRQVAATAGELC